MKLSKETLSILKNFSQINTNLVIKDGSTIETMIPSKDLIGIYESEDAFDESVSIFNLNEFLGVLGAFEQPELELLQKEMKIKQGKQKVSYVYADEKLLITPPSDKSKFKKAMVAPFVSFTLTDVMLDKLQKMSSIISAPDLSIVGDGKTIILKVHDKKNPSCNEFEIDTELATTETFSINYKMERMLLYPGTYKVSVSDNKKISSFEHTSVKLTYYIGLEADSQFD